ncbi:hypothetical protein SAMN05421788_103124 [Filimonas lacunae]|uniref:Uncharacterized protein n=1 Tax=Filimonas lacunae TaxID=477680 RepID=A0A173MJJ3_9BACT|nr:DUF5682 family protein [Filimonas lacunae]BAV07774.1 hypothetical protein FLA_3805 [Filimonas lacunae]SIT04603.1 hypothetical protein SAMN05421788_103124 [Filimonas lacunae]
MVHVLGIRHHGPGSASNVKAFLEATKPDIVLVEGPPEADDILSWVGNEAFQPPVAILVYQSDNLQRSVFYPFATFSPEWQAIQYARQNNIPVRFMDMPVYHVFALQQQVEDKAKLVGAEPPLDAVPGARPDPADVQALQPQPEGGVSPVQANEPVTVNEQAPAAAPIPAVAETPEEALMALHPLMELSAVAGYNNSDRWWEHMFEYRTNNEQVFEAVSEAMHAAREAAPPERDTNELLREAWMRKIIRQAQKEMYTEVAVICGAWHVPALTSMPAAKEDNELLKGLPKVKTECTWIPWTYSRLSYYSGYGAGIESPGWYQHIWQYPHDDGSRWMAKVAQLFRQKQMDTSVAHIIESVRLAQSLAALRELPRPGLEELNEATLSVVCNGDAMLMQLIHDELIVSNVLGAVPAAIPKPPLQADIEKWQKKLRLPAGADWKDYTLDLRKENDLERSIFLHRLQVLDIQWGKRSEVSGKGTFKEQWRLQWNPSFAIEIIDKGVWGNTVEAAAAAYVQHLAADAGSLRELCNLLEDALPAELPQAVEKLIHRVSNLSAATADVMQLMQVLTPLVSVSRYGNVRKTDAALVAGIVTEMITRICISLPGACTGIADDAAQQLLNLFLEMNNAINILQQGDSTQQWQQTLQRIAGSYSSSPVLAGYSTRLLADYKLLEGEELVKAFYSAVSPSLSPGLAAAWLEGFLKGSGTLLLVDATLWQVVNNWVQQLNEEAFVQVLPLLRRTFSGFTAPERRKLGEKVKQGDAGVTARQGPQLIHEQRAAQGLPVIGQLLGYTQ